MTIKSMNDLKIVGASAKCITLNIEGTTGFMRNRIFNKLVKNLNMSNAMEVVFSPIRVENKTIPMWGIMSVEF